MVVGTADEFDWPKDDLTAEQQLSDILRDGGTKLTQAQDTKGDLAWNVEYRIVHQPNRTLMPVINFNKEAVTIKFPDLAGKQATDLLSEDGVDLQNLTLQPMVPMLLEVK